MFKGSLDCCHSNYRLCPFYRHWPLGEVFQYTSPFVLCGHFLGSTMSTQFCRVVELMRSACCQTLRNRSCLRRAVLAPDSSSALCVPGIPGIQRRAYSLDSLSSGPGRPTFSLVSQQHCAERVPPSSALTHRNLSAVAVQVGSFLWLCQALNTATERNVFILTHSVTFGHFLETCTVMWEKLPVFIFILSLCSEQQQKTYCWVCPLYKHLQGQRRPLCRYDFLDLGEVEENVRRAQECKKMRHFIVDPDLANLVAQHLGPENAKTVIFECNPGTDSPENWKSIFIHCHLIVFF